jgi:tRNA (mo5U34)-methyltransferase
MVLFEYELSDHGQMSGFKQQLEAVWGSSLATYLFSVRDLLEKHFSSAELNGWWERIEPDLLNTFRKSGKTNFWEAQVSQLPSIKNSSIDSGSVVKVQSSDISSRLAINNIQTVLQHMKPWRKGPFNYFGIHVDSEWRSDMKWARISPVLGSLQNKKVLDVGCGNGYYMWRMLEKGASLVLGIDPSVLCLAQFRSLSKYARNAPLGMIPVGTETLSEEMSWFDVVFSMGVLYHRRDPLSHLIELRNMLKPGGRVVLETLIIDSREKEKLIPESRYAQMRNVWELNSPPVIEEMLQSVGFKDVSCVDVSKTTIEEQRATHWIDSFSLEDFLDPTDCSRTVEGYPAPVRACFIATL